MENSKEPAFACASDYKAQTGLTKLEYFTAMAMQGIMSIPGNDLEDRRFFAEYIAEKSVKIAKETLNQLEKEK